MFPSSLTPAVLHLPSPSSFPPPPPHSLSASTLLPSLSLYTSTTLAHLQSPLISPLLSLSTPDICHSSILHPRSPLSHLSASSELLLSLTSSPSLPLPSVPPSSSLESLHQRHRPPSTPLSPALPVLSPLHASPLLRRTDSRLTSRIQLNPLLLSPNRRPLFITRMGLSSTPLPVHSTSHSFRPSPSSHQTSLYPSGSSSLQLTLLLSVSSLSLSSAPLFLFPLSSSTSHTPLSSHPPDSLHSSISIHDVTLPQLPLSSLTTHSSSLILPYPSSHSLTSLSRSTESLSLYCLISLGSLLSCIRVPLPPTPHRSLAHHPSLQAASSFPYSPSNPQPLAGSLTRYRRLTPPHDPLTLTDTGLTPPFPLSSPSFSPSSPLAPNLNPSSPMSSSSHPISIHSHIPIPHPSISLSTPLSSASLPQSPSIPSQPPSPQPFATLSLTLTGPYPSETSSLDRHSSDTTSGSTNSPSRSHRQLSHNPGQSSRSSSTLISSLSILSPSLLLLATLSSQSTPEASPHSLISSLTVISLPSTSIMPLLASPDPPTPPYLLLSLSPPPSHSHTRSKVVEVCIPQITLNLSLSSRPHPSSSPTLSGLSRPSLSRPLTPSLLQLSITTIPLWPPILTISPSIPPSHYSPPAPSLSPTPLPDLRLNGTSAQSSSHHPSCLILSLTFSPLRHTPRLLPTPQARSLLQLPPSTPREPISLIRLDPPHTHIDPSTASAHSTHPFRSHLRIRRSLLIATSNHSRVLVPLLHPPFTLFRHSHTNLIPFSKSKPSYLSLLSLEPTWLRLITYSPSLSPSPPSSSCSPLDLSPKHLLSPLLVLSPPVLSLHLTPTLTMHQHLTPVDPLSLNLLPRIDLSKTLSSPPRPDLLPLSSPSHLTPSFATLTRSALSCNHPQTKLLPTLINLISLSCRILSLSPLQHRSPLSSRIDRPPNRSPPFETLISALPSLRDLRHSLLTFSPGRSSTSLDLLIALISLYLSALLHTSLMLTLCLSSSFLSPSSCFYSSSRSSSGHSQLLCSSSTLLSGSRIPLSTHLPLSLVSQSYSLPLSISLHSFSHLSPPSPSPARLIAPSRIPLTATLSLTLNNSLLSPDPVSIRLSLLFSSLSRSPRLSHQSHFILHTHLPLLLIHSNVSFLITLQTSLLFPSSKPHSSSNTHCPRIHLPLPTSRPSPLLSLSASPSTIPSHSPLPNLSQSNASSHLSSLTPHDPLSPRTIYLSLPRSLLPPSHADLTSSLTTHRPLSTDHLHPTPSPPSPLSIRQIRLSLREHSTNQLSLPPPGSLTPRSSPRHKTPSHESSLSSSPPHPVALTPTPLSRALSRSPLSAHYNSYLSPQLHPLSPNLSLSRQKSLPIFSPSTSHSLTLFAIKLSISTTPPVRSLSLSDSPPSLSTSIHRSVTNLLSLNIHLPSPSPNPTLSPHLPHSSSRPCLVTNLTHTCNSSRSLSPSRLPKASHSANPQLAPTVTLPVPLSHSLAHPTPSYYAHHLSAVSRHRFDYHPPSLSHHLSSSPHLSVSHLTLGTKPPPSSVLGHHQLVAISSPSPTSLRHVPPSLSKSSHPHRTSSSPPPQHSSPRSLTASSAPLTLHIQYSPPPITHPPSALFCSPPPPSSAHPYRSYPSHKVMNSATLRGPKSTPSQHIPRAHFNTPHRILSIASGTLSSHDDSSPLITLPN
uniref:Uncharacterized protein n=1 Tax=Knipowitschia caucasica TaxID=637954 RepID=A0AAV2MGN2_KNICA